MAREGIACSDMAKDAPMQPRVLTAAAGAVQELGARAPVIVAGKDVGEVDTDYLLLPVSIRDHEGPLGASFPIENRLLPQGVRLAWLERRTMFFGCAEAAVACVGLQ